MNHRMARQEIFPGLEGINFNLVIGLRQINDAIEIGIKRPFLKDLPGKTVLRRRNPRKSLDYQKICFTPVERQEKPSVTIRFPPFFGSNQAGFCMPKSSFDERNVLHIYNARFR